MISYLAQLAASCLLLLPFFATSSPSPNATACALESCMVMPTNCDKRAECRGCGALCFNENSASTAYDKFLNLTGLGEQASGTDVFPSLPLTPGALPACPWPTKSNCLRGNGNLTVKQWKAHDAPSQSPTACCAACSRTEGCVAWQLIKKKGTAPQACWAMGTTDGKPDSPDTCVSAVPVAGPVPEVRTADFVVQWHDLEPAPGQFDWSTLDSAVARARNAKGQLIMLLWTGQDAPHWLYTNASYNVGMLAHNKDMSEVCPDYTSPTYLVRLKHAHSALAKKILSTPGYLDAFLALQPCVGSTGDDTPIHVTTGSGNRPFGWSFVNQTLLDKINGPAPTSSSKTTDLSWWSSFTRNFSTWLATDDEAFAAPVASQDLVLLINAQGKSFPFDWAEDHLPGSFVKLGQTGHEYQSNYERFRIAAQVPFTFGLQRGRPVRSRAELSAETCWTDGAYRNASACPVPWNMWAMTQWLATAHLDFWNLQPNSVPHAFPDPRYRPLWRFLNRYAGLRWPRQSDGAWIGFRDGLDAMDTARFPEAEFGPLSTRMSSDTGYPTVICGPGMTARAVKICAAHQKQGCRIDVEDALCGGPMTQRRARAMNDVAFGNWRADYGNFMSIADPNASRGWWRTGDRQGLFGRFARGFADPTNASAVLPLQLDRGLWGGLPLEVRSSMSLALRLVFLDEGTGTFGIGYDGVKGPTTLRQVRKTNSGRWRELCATIADGRFDGAGPGGADLWLSNVDTTDDVFDSLELAQGDEMELALAGCDWGK